MYIFRTELLKTWKINVNVNAIEIDTRMLEPITRILDYSKKDQNIRVPGYSMLDYGITKCYFYSYTFLTENKMVTRDKNGLNMSDTDPFAACNTKWCWTTLCWVSQWFASLFNLKTYYQNQQKSFLVENWDGIHLGKEFLWKKDNHKDFPSMCRLYC